MLNLKFSILFVAALILVQKLSAEPTRSNSTVKPNFKYDVEVFENYCLELRAREQEFYNSPSAVQREIPPPSALYPRPNDPVTGRNHSLSQEERNRQGKVLIQFYQSLSEYRADPSPTRKFRPTKGDLVCDHWYPMQTFNNAYTLCRVALEEVRANTTGSPVPDLSAMGIARGQCQFLCNPIAKALDTLQFQSGEELKNGINNLLQNFDSVPPSLPYSILMAETSLRRSRTAYGIKIKGRVMTAADSRARFGAFLRKTINCYDGAYKKFRETRRQMREKGTLPNGWELIPFMGEYNPRVEGPPKADGTRRNYVESLQYYYQREGFEALDILWNQFDTLPVKTNTAASWSQPVSTSPPAAQPQRRHRGRKN